MEALQGTARKLYDFAKLHGLREDWHEPDEQGVEAYVRDNDKVFDNAHGDQPGYGEMTLNLWITGKGGDHSPYDIYLNLATLCALATIGAGVVLGETQPTSKVNENLIKVPVIPEDELPRFSRNDLAMILSTVLKSIGGD